jgi:hypothetical protein
MSAVLESGAVEGAVPETLPAVAGNSPAAMMIAALDRGVDPARIEKMLELQERYEANEARKAYNTAFTAFKEEAVQIIKNKQVTDGPLKGKAYAELFSVVNALTPALSRHGLSASWKVTKDEKDWLEVTCTLRHVQGHQESVSMGGPPDTGGAKNAVQARASTKSYLERYTLKAICGVAEGGDDDDGNGGRTDDWLAKVGEATTEEELREISRDGTKAFTQARNVKGYAAFMKAVQQHGAKIKEKGHA